MRRLSASLLLVVIVAVFGLGLAFDTLFERYSAKPTESLSLIRSLGQGLASVLNSADNPGEDSK